MWQVGIVVVWSVLAVIVWFGGLLLRGCVNRGLRKSAAQRDELIERVPLPWEVTKAIRHAYQRGWISDLVAVGQIHRATHARLTDHQAERILHHGEESVSDSE